MKNYLSIIILSILTIRVFAQDITVSFKTSDAGAVIDSVQAINLATNDTVNLMGNETLTLVNSTSGAVTIQNLKGGIFPNPCNGSATLKFSTSSGDDATIQVVNSSGQLVIEKKQAITAGAHSFSIGFPGPGIYVVLVRAGNQVLSFKQVSNMAGMQEASLSYLGSSLKSLETATFKSAKTGKTLSYTTGNNIMYTIYSGKNIRVMVDQPSASKTFDVAFYSCADKDGKNYKTVAIGTQTWMAENLAYLPDTTPTSTWSNTDPCYYVYDYAAYGVLYNWPAALTACPAGWHLPSDAEWTTLSDYLTNNGYGYGGNGSDIAKALASATGWDSYSEAGTPGNDPGNNNSSCFSALPGGDCYHGFGFFTAGYSADWWSSTAYDEDDAWGRSLFYYGSGLTRGGYYRHHGFSVRCLRD